MTATTCTAWTWRRGASTKSEPSVRPAREKASTPPPFPPGACTRFASSPGRPTFCSSTWACHQRVRDGSAGRFSDSPPSSSRASGGGGSGRFAGGDRLSPLVVGLAAGLTLHLVDEVHALGDLVAGHVAAAVLLQIFRRRRRAGPQGDHGGDALAPSLVGEPDHQGVVHVGVGLEGVLHLLG